MVRLFFCGMRVPAWMYRTTAPIVMYFGSMFTLVYSWRGKQYVWPIAGRCCFVVVGSDGGGDHKLAFTPKTETNGRWMYRDAGGYLFANGVNATIDGANISAGA